MLIKRAAPCQSAKRALTRFQISNLKRIALLIVFAFISAYSALFTFLAVAQHEAHHTSVFDLGVYDQIIWNTAHGRILTYCAEPDFGDNFLATHLQPILILLAPLYWIWDDVRVLFNVGIRLRFGCASCSRSPSKRTWR